MTPEQINIKIAEACGWTHLKDFIGPNESGIGTSRGTAWLPPGAVMEEMEWFEVADLFKTKPPDYCADLNAMHEAEKVLADPQEGTYLDLLAQVCGHQYKSGSERNEHLFWCWNSTAMQRAEAFLRALNKWEEAA